MLKRFFKIRVKATTLVEVLISSVIIMIVFFTGNIVILNSAVKRPIASDLKVEMLYFSEINRNPKLVLSKDTLRYPTFYVVNKFERNDENNIVFIDVELFSTKNYLISKHRFIREDNKVDF